MTLAEEMNQRIQEAREHRGNIDIDSALEMIRHLTDERKVLYEALKRVQGACTEKEMERRRLVAENKELRTSMEKMIDHDSPLMKILERRLAE